MNILYQSDNNYATMLGVSLTSLLINNTEEDCINIYIIDGGISEDNKKRIECTVEKYNRKITFIRIDNLNKKLETIGANKLRNSYMTYYKLFVRDFLPKDIAKLLYIDCDTIVTDIRDVFDLDLGTNAVAMAQDLFLYNYKKKHGIKAEEKCFNAGVILFNYQVWDEMGYDDVLQKFIESVDMSIMKKHEQDVLNLAFKGHIYEMPLRYNCYGPLKLTSVDDFYSVYKKVLLFSKEEISDEINSACIFHFLHFIGKGPNNKDSEHPYSNLYHLYKTKSEWKNEDDTDVSVSSLLIFEKWLLHLLPPKWFMYCFKKAHDLREEI